MPSTTSTSTFKVRLRKNVHANTLSSSSNQPSNTSNLVSTNSSNSIPSTNANGLNVDRPTDNDNIEKQLKPKSADIKKYKITPKLKQNNNSSKFISDQVDSKVQNNMNSQCGFKNTEEMTQNSSMTKNSFYNTSTNTTTSNYTYRTNLHESLELKRRIQLMSEKSELVKKFQKFASKVNDDELDEQDESNIDQTEETVASDILDKNKNSVEIDNETCKDSQVGDKIVRAFSADDSVVEVLRENFQPQFVNDINFEIFKLPNSQQKTNIKLSGSKVKLTAKKSNLKKNVADESSKVDSRGQSSKSNSYLKPINLDLHLASAIDSKNNNIDLNLSNNKRKLSSGVSKSFESLKLNSSDHSKSTNIELGQSEISSSFNKGSLMGSEKKNINGIRRNNSLELKCLNPVLLSSTGRKLSSLENIVRSSNKSLPNNGGNLIRSSNKAKSSFSSQSNASNIYKNSNENKNGSKVSDQIRNIHVNKKCYQILNKIGRGGSSTVYQVYDLELKSILALKVVDLSKADESIRIGFKNEINLLEKLRHCSRVVRMYDYEFRNSDRELLIVMEKGDDDLSNVFKSYCETEKKFSPHLIRFYWQEMLKVVQEIHENNVVHSDLKPVNFILVSGKLKLIDFGIANAIQSNKTSVYKDCIIGTVDYMAPESFQKSAKCDGKQMVKYNQKSDIWSLGIILFNLVYGFTPFSHIKDNFKKSYAIINSDIKYPKIDDLLLVDVIKQCLQRDPNKRPTTTELLSHKYLSQLPLNNKNLQSNCELNSASANIHPELISQINNLTPNTLRCLSKVIESFSKK